MKALHTFYPGDENLWICGIVAVQITLIVALAALLSRFCFRRHAAARHVVWAAGLCGVLLSPLTAYVWSGTNWSLINLPVLSPPSAAGPVDPVGNHDQPGTRADDFSLARNELRFEDRLPIEEVFSAADAAPTDSAVAPQTVPSTGHESSMVATVERRSSEQADDAPFDTEVTMNSIQTIAAVAVFVWLLGVFYHVLRFVHGWRKVRRFLLDRRDFSHDGLAGVLRTVKQRLEVSALPPLFISDRTTTPLVAGFLRPAVYLPAGAVHWKADELRDVLLHECAHVIRRDQFLGLLQILSAALFWPHPLVHALNRCLSRAREEACDDYVIQDADPRDYARLLLAFSEKRFAETAGPAAFAMVSPRWNLEHRIAGLLDSRRRRTPRCSYFVTAGTALILFAACVLVGGTRLSTAAQREPGSADSAAAESGDRAAVKPVVVADDLYGDPIPAGAGVRLGTVRFRHGGWHKYVGFAADNKTVLSFSSDQQSIRFWDAMTGRLLREVRTNMNGSRWFRMSPDRQTAAVLGFVFVEEDKTNYRVIELWDAISGKLKSTIRWSDQFGEAVRLEFTPDGKTIVVGDTSGMILFFDVSTGVEILRYNLSQMSSRQSDVKGLAVSPDGQYIAAATYQGLFLWDWLSEAGPEQIDPARRLSGLAFSPDSRLLAAAGEEAVKLIDVATKAPVKQLKNDAQAHMSVKQLAFTPDGTTLVAADSISIPKAVKSVLVWDVASGELKRRLTSGSMKPRSVDISADGRLVAAADWDGQLAVWDLTTGKETAEGIDERGHQSSVSSISFSQDRTSVVTAGDDQTARVWDVETGRQEHLLKHGHWVRAMTHSPDGSRIATSSLDNTVALWDAATGRKIHQLAGNGKSGGRRALVFSPDGLRLAAWGDDLQLKIWNVETGTNLHDFPIRPTGIEIPEGTAGANARFSYAKFRTVDGWGFSKDATTLMLIFDRTVYVFDVATGQERKKFEIEFRPRFEAISPDAKWLMTSGPAGSQVTTELASGGIRSSESDKHAVRLYDLQTGRQKWEYVIPPKGGAGPVAFSHDGKMMATAFRHPHNEIRFWSVETGKELGAIKNVTNINRKIAFSPQGDRFGCAMQDGDVLIWDLQLFGIKNKLP